MATTAETKRAGAAKGKLEVHEHCIISGPRAHRTGNWPAGMGYKFAHSHEGGNVPHEHPNTGPASYTIDKDEWLRATGLRGGGRKKFTVKPNGEQFPYVEREPMTFEIIIVGDGGRAASGGAEGPGVAPAARMTLGFGMKAVAR